MKKLKTSDGRVEEEFQNGDFKLYKVTDLRCKCTFFNEHLAPCRHILFERKTENAPLFDASTFDRRYIRAAANDDASSTFNQAIDSDNQLDTGVGIDFDSVTDK